MSTIGGKRKPVPKRAYSPTPGTPSKKKRPATPQTSPAQASTPVPVEVKTEIKTELPAEVIEAITEADSNASSPSQADIIEPTKQFIFKEPNFVHSMKGAAGNKKMRIWKNLKQIMTTERSLIWGPDDATYSNIEAPPSFKPPKKYSDLSGLPAKYTDPHTRLRYTTADEFARIKLLPSDLVSGHLALRKATNPVG